MGSKMGLIFTIPFDSI